VTGRLVSLDDPAARDPLVAGAKAAWLAEGRRAGLAVLPGLVVRAEESREALRAGVAALSARGSGGARLVVGAAPLEPSVESELATIAGQLGERLVVRSSSRLEAGGEWAGAFTSYVDIPVVDVPTAVRGCWASAFSVDALRRLDAAGIEPGAAPMAVLIQPAISPAAGGAVRIDGDAVEIVGGLGSPASVLQGWEPGVVARVASDGAVSGSEAERVLGMETVATIAAAMREAMDRTGATAAEWALVDRHLILLQLGIAPPSAVREPRPTRDALRDPLALAIARLVRRAPGPPGETLILPWALAAADVVADLFDTSRAQGPDVPRSGVGQPSPSEAAARLAAQVWGESISQVDAVLADLRGVAPESALARIRALPRPDLVLARAAVDAFVGRARAPGAAPGSAAIGRRGLDRWEPFSADVAMANSEPIVGVPGSGGLGAGRLAWVPGPLHADTFRPRDILVAPRPLPQLAPLLWDAAGIVTVGGGPGAHLLESARALGIPAVTGIDAEALGSMPPATDVCVAIDGWSGQVFAVPF
jgi:hypothetical protein